MHYYVTALAKSKADIREIPAELVRHMCGNIYWGQRGEVDRLYGGSPERYLKHTLAVAGEWFTTREEAETAIDRGSR